MKQVVITPEGPKVLDVPDPTIRTGTVLVRTAYSCVSTGTELAGIAQASVPLWRRAVSEPRRAIDKAAELTRQGPASLRREWVQRRGALASAGYSSAGIVESVGRGVEDIAPGDRVACGGAGVADHAELVVVPRNLLTRIPDCLDLRSAALTTVGAIALQGVRRADPTIGESVGVVGLGLIGQLTLRIVKANGCTVVAFDPDVERAAMARRAGADLSLTASGDQAVAEARLATSGIGLDAVIIAASAQSSEVIAHALAMCRHRGRIVVVGQIGMELPRDVMFEKELDVRMSTSYGPGRYDRAFEEDGLDYPIGHVRWTETRNLEAVARLLADGAVDVHDLISRECPVDEAPTAFHELATADPRPLTVLLRYDTVDRGSRTATVRRRSGSRRGVVRVGVIGAGSFASAVHLPILASTAGVEIRHIVARTPVRAMEIASRFDAAFASTSAEAVLTDDSVDAVLVATRHDTHAELVSSCIAAGKHVLVEKPLGLSERDLQRVEAAMATLTEDVVVLTGFNRRFSPLIAPLRERLAARSGAAIVACHVNAGFLPSDHWVHGPEGGGRNVGEACHFYDLFRFLLDDAAIGFDVAPLLPRSGPYRRDDNFVATVSFGDGSLASLTYTAMGSDTWPKERVLVEFDGRSALVDDWRTLEWEPTRRGSRPAPQQKGYAEEWNAFLGAVRGESEWPVPFEEQMEVARLTLDIDGHLRRSADS